MAESNLDYPPSGLLTLYCICVLYLTNVSQLLENDFKQKLYLKDLIFELFIFTEHSIAL